MEIHKKTKIRITFDPTIPFLDIDPEKTHDSKRYMYSNVHCSTIYNRQDIEATEMSIDNGVDKEDVHIYNGILLSH